MSALGGLVLAVGFPGALRAENKPKYGADGMADGWVDDPLAFVSIGEDGTSPSSFTGRDGARRPHQHGDDRGR